MIRKVFVRGLVLKQSQNSELPHSLEKTEVWNQDGFLYMSFIYSKCPLNFNLKKIRCLAWKTLSLAGFVHVWFTSLHVRAHSNACYIGETVWQFSTRVKGLKEPLTFSYICKILNIVAPCIQKIVSMFWITPLSRLFRENNPL